LSGVPAITGEYTVNKMQASSGIFYLMTGMDPQNPPYPPWQNVTTYYSCSPPGPWTTRTVVYTTPETGAAGCSVGTLFTYDPRAHAEFTNSSGVLISYNVNANNGQDLVCANDYKPPVYTGGDSWPDRAFVTRLVARSGTGYCWPTAARDRMSLGGVQTVLTTASAAILGRLR